MANKVISHLYFKQDPSPSPASCSDFSIQGRHGEAEKVDEPKRFQMEGGIALNPPANYVICQLVNLLANGSLFVHGSTLTDSAKWY